MTAPDQGVMAVPEQGVIGVAGEQENMKEGQISGAVEHEEIKKPAAAVDDPWDVKEMATNEKAWDERNPVEKLTFVALQLGKGLMAICVLYLFIISLSMMGAAFKILAGPTAGQVFRNNELFGNPIAGLVIGVLVTVLVQSSSTSTSIIVTMTGADLINVKDAVPMIMGANIGTSITNTIVSIAQIGDKDQYRRAFAGATVHDCFNLLNVLVLLPIEIATGLLRHLAMGVTEAAGIDDDTENQEKVDFLKKVTKPVTARLVQVDKKLVTKVAQETDEAALEKLLKKSMIVQSKDSHLFMDTPMSDTLAGVILLIASLAFLTTCLILLVKLLQTIFRGRAAIWMRSLLNLEIKSVPFIADYILILFGVGITILMQSSSVTTSTLTPLVGIGLIKLDKMFPFTVGANIGTTVTGVLAAFASSNIALGLQVALCHLFFNLIGTLIWFPVPMMRRVPIAMAKALGNLAADLTWFPFAYLAFTFGVLPTTLLLLSLAGPAVIGVFGSLLLLALAAIIIVVALRQTKPHILPAALCKDPAWLPPSLRMEPPAEGDAVGVLANSVDGDAGSWAMAPATWGIGWILLILLVCAVPNAQWSNLKYPTFDARSNVGFTAWSACSKMFEADMQYATLAEFQGRNSCTSWEVRDCAAIKDCGKDGFADEEDINEEYEASWNNCSTKCGLHTWESECLSMGCGGKKHGLQCKQVTKAVHMEERSYPVQYKATAEKAWSKGEFCRPISLICDADIAAVFGHAGNLAVVGTICLAAAQALILTYQFLGKSFARCLQGALAMACSGWIFLLASWAVFDGAMGNEAVCIVPDMSGVGVVSATGAFKDITDGGGSYSFYFVLLAWALTTPMIGLVAHRVVIDMSPQITPGTAEPAKQEKVDVAKLEKFDV